CDSAVAAAAAAARSGSLPSVASTTCTAFVTAFVLAASVASTLAAAGAAPGALAPAPSVLGRVGQAVAAVATGLSSRLWSLRGWFAGDGGTIAGGASAPLCRLAPA